MEDGTLTNRYTVTRNDGKPVAADKRYFVLDLSTPDVRDFAALQSYAHACEVTGYPQLAENIRAELDRAKREGAVRYAVGQRVRLVGWDDPGVIDQIDPETGDIWVTSESAPNYSVAYPYVDMEPVQDQRTS